MSGIPEFRRVREEGPKLPPIRRAAGIVGLIAGILMMIGYVLLAISIFLIMGLVFVLAEALQPSLVMVGAVAADIAIIAFAIGIYSLLAGLRGRKGHPGRTAASLAGLWAVLMLIMYALGITTVALGGEAGLRAYVPFIVGIIGTVLVLVAAFTVRPGASFGAWVAGSSMGLAGLALIIYSKHLGAYPAMQAMNIPTGLLTEIATLTYTPALIGGIIAAASLIIAPFIGARRAWISEIIAAAGAIVAAASIAYKSIINIERAYTIYKIASLFTGDIAELLKAIGITTTVSLSLITAATITGIIALILAITHLATTATKTQ